MDLGVALGICGILLAVFGIGATVWYGRRHARRLQEGHEALLRNVVKAVAPSPLRGSPAGPTSTERATNQGRERVALGPKPSPHAAVPTGPEPSAGEKPVRTCVGVADVTNDGGLDVLTELCFKDRATLKVLGLRDKGPVLLSETLANSSGFGFFVEDRDGDGRPELVTLDAESGTGSGLSLRSYRWSGSGFDLVANEPQSDLDSSELDHYRGLPDWCS